ncbi:LamG-like jellyroll fold domain-containing protein [Nocardioides sp. LHG3406-4]|uniref:LamG-like jellyroll fold domain-containing protein n=1 Tax=Nocardioides sp. LHG3406-4 TaxID=2804575 RepID=UPI003CF2001B
MTSALLRRLAGAVAGIAATGGLAVVASPADAAPALLISTDATTWSYLDDGSDPAAELPHRTDWTDPGFDDSGWKTAEGSFGAREGALATVSGFMPNTLLNQYSTGTTDIPAYFFRTEVDVPAGALDDVSSLSASLVYDDAATVYVNGVRVSGFDDETITANLSYGGSNSDVPKPATFTVPASLFVSGSNTVAVELHQGRTSSSDIYLDFTSLQLGADVPPVAAAVSDTDTMAVIDEVTFQGGEPELPADWLVPDAKQRLPFTVEGAGLSGSLEGFPALVKLDNDDLDFAAADPDHLVFTAGSDPTPLSYQVEKWEPTGSSVWVKLPNVGATASEIELYFDGAPQNTTTATDVWDTDYITVNHFNAASGDFADATANGWTGTAIGANASYGAESGSGTPAYQITGANTSIDFGTEMAHASTAAVTFSTSVWLDPSQCTAEDTGYRVLAGRDIGGGKKPGETYSLVCYQGKVFPRFVVGDGTTSVGVNASNGNALASTEWPAGAWHELATTFDGSMIRTYLDGEEMATYAVSGTIGDGLTPPRFIVDGYDNATGGVKMAIDEMRISTVARSADWMKAEHLAQTGALVKVGAIEAPTQLQLSVTKPENGARVEGSTLELAGTTSGAEVTYRVDDAAPVSLGTVNGDYSATIEGLALGAHNIEIVAIDGDSQKTITRSFTVVEPGAEGEPRLSVSDDDVVSGLVDLGVIRPDGPPSADGVSITVDGTSLPVTVRNDQASAVFEVGGWQTGFKQDITLNGQSLNPPRADFSGTMRLDIPVDGLHEGANTLRVATGSGVETADTARNNDDFDIRDPRIEFLGTGLTLRDPSVDPGAKLLIGDGFPAGTANPPVYYRDFTIEVAPGQLTALVASWDTALAADGEHTVTSTTPGGSVSATVVSDNTAPTVTFNEPSDGGRYTGSFDIDVAAADPHEVDTLTLTLDGTEVSQGDVIEIDSIGAGEHTLTAHVIDSMGNANDVSATFATIGNAPDEAGDPRPADGATNVDPAQVEFSVTASDQAGDALDVTFKRAFEGAATSVKEGTTKVAVPGADAGASVDAGDKLSAVDGDSVTTSADRAYPFQQFEVAVPSGITADEFTIAWNGSVPTGHRAALSVWDHSTNAWKPLAEGAGGEPLALTATAVRADTVRGGVAQVLVQDEPKVVLDDDDVATISWVTDTQNYSEREATTYDKQLQWTLDNWKTDDIAYGVHTGDIVNVASQRVQWQNASKSHKLWDEADFPYGVVPGNHDIAGGQYETYREFFGEARFKDNPWYGGTNQDNVQHYDLFSTPDADYLFLYVDWSLSQDEIDWANEVIDSHPTYNVVLATHQYLLNGGAYVTPGQEIFDKIVLPNPSVKMILSGHTPGVAMNIKRPSQDRVIVEVMQDSQAVGFAGDGWMRTFDMDATNQTTTHRTFSVSNEGNNFAGNGETFVAPENWSGTTNAENFTVPMDIELASREISTDALVATTFGEDRLGQPVHVESGSRAAVTVRNLESATTHQWYAEAKDAGGHSSVSDVFTFTTAEGSAPQTPLGISVDPKITGAAEVGSTLTAMPAVFTGGPTDVTGQWLADGVPIEGQTATKVVVTVDLIGKRISYRSVAAKTGVDSVTATSASLAPVARLSVRPSITVRPTTYGSAGQIGVAITVPTALGSVPGTVTVRGVGPAQTRAAGAGALVFGLPATLRPGRYTATVDYSGSDKVDPVTEVVEVLVGKRAVAGSAVEAKVIKRPTPGKRGKATVRVATLDGLTSATGRVTVTLRQGRVSKRATATLVRGRATVRLPKLARGKWRMSVSYGGNAYYLQRTDTGPAVSVPRR